MKQVYIQTNGIQTATKKINDIQKEEKKRVGIIKHLLFRWMFWDKWCHVS